MNEKLTPEAVALLAQERERFPLIKQYAYFDTASTGLIPDYVYEGVGKYQSDRYLVGGDSVWGDEGMGTLAMMARAKENIAKMVGARAEDIAFGQSSSQMFTLFSEGLALSPGDNVILTDTAWISTRFAWQCHEEDGLEIRMVKTRDGAYDPADVFALADERTRAVSISAVESSNGFFADLAPIGAFCRERGIYFAVDGVQALGVLPIDVAAMHIDFLVGNDYKWMMHFCGTGYAYVSPGLRGKLGHWGAGWMSDDERFNTGKKHLRLREDAGRYELGYPCASGIYALGMVAHHYNTLTPGVVYAHVQSLVSYLYQRAAACPFAAMAAMYPQKNRSTIAVLLVDGAVPVTEEALKARGVFAGPRPGYGPNGETGIRLSLHYYNNTADIDRLFAVLAELAG